MPGSESLQPSDVLWMSSLFVEDQNTGLSNTSVVLQVLPLMPVDKLQNLTDFPELWQNKQTDKINHRGGSSESAVM